MGMTSRRPDSGDEPGSADAVTSIGLEFRDFRGAGPSNSRSSGPPGRWADRREASGFGGGAWTEFIRVSREGGGGGGAIGGGAVDPCSGHSADTTVETEDIARAPMDRAVEIVRPGDGGTTAVVKNPDGPGGFGERFEAPRAGIATAAIEVPVQAEMEQQVPVAPPRVRRAEPERMPQGCPGIGPPGAFLVVGRDAHRWRQVGVPGVAGRQAVGSAVGGQPTAAVGPVDVGAEPPLPEPGKARACPRGVARPGQGRQQQRAEERQDREHDQQLQQREAPARRWGCAMAGKLNVLLMKRAAHGAYPSLRRAARRSFKNLHPDRFSRIRGERARWDLGDRLRILRGQAAAGGTGSPGDIPGSHGDRLLSGDIRAPGTGSVFRKPRLLGTSRGSAGHLGR